MKKIFFISILIILFYMVINVSAQSLFPLLSTPIPEHSDLAPSYSGFANVKADKEEPYGNNGIHLTYNSVKEDKYLQFGDYLQNLGFENSTQPIVKDNGRSVEMKLNNGKFNIGIVYNADDEILHIIYEDSTNYEKMDNFAEFNRIKLGDVIEIKGLGRYCFINFFIDKSIKTKYFWYPDSIWGKMYSEYFTSNSYIVYSFYNTSQEDMFLTVEGELVYINDDNLYSYPLNMHEYISEHKKQVAYAKGNLDPDSFNSVAPLTTGTGMVGFQIPQSLQKSADGTLAIIIKLNPILENEKYVLILRENGRKIGDW